MLGALVIVLRDIIAAACDAAAPTLTPALREIGSLADDMGAECVLVFCRPTGVPGDVALISVRGDPSIHSLVANLLAPHARELGVTLAEAIRTKENGALQRLIDLVLHRK